MRTFWLLAVALVAVTGCAVHVGDPYARRSGYERSCRARGWAQGYARHRNCEHDCR